MKCTIQNHAVVGGAADSQRGEDFGEGEVAAHGFRQFEDVAMKNSWAGIPNDLVCCRIQRITHSARHRDRA